MPTSTPRPRSVAASAEAATGQPKIYTRAQWGADESIRLHECPGGPDYSSTIKIGFVHHTVSTNDYSAAQVPAMIRSFYAYHVLGNGWCDIGYNFLVDRFGRLWEGRYGGIDKAVIGSHTGGFNRNSFAVSMIGDVHLVDAELLDAAVDRQADGLEARPLLPQPAGHRLARLRRRPVPLLRFQGVSGRLDVELNVISGHRDADVGHTDCPGAAG